MYLDLEAGRKRTGFEDIFIGYHASDDVQVTYAGKSFHIGRNYHVSPVKRNVRESKSHGYKKVVSIPVDVNSIELVQVVLYISQNGQT